MEFSEQMNRLCLGCMGMLPQPGMPCPKCGFDLAAYRSEPQELPIGTVLAGKYLVGRSLGQGGFGITYIGWDINLAIKVAIKEYFPEGCVARDQSTHTTLHTYSGDRAAMFETGRDRFVSEARTVAQFSKLPCIVNVRDFFKENGTAYIVMEFVEGETLQSYARRMGGRISAQDLLPRLRTLIESLQRLHEAGMLHRDISPDNIMLQPDGTLKLLDFGAARQMSLSGERNNTINVKHGFAPEEQYRTHGEQGPWTDVYALCATIYRLTTGVTPVQAMDRLVGSDSLVPPTQLGADLTPQQEAAILGGMAVLARDRTQNMRALYQALYGASPAQSAPTAVAAAAPVRPAETYPLLSEYVTRWPGRMGDAGIAALMMPLAQQLQAMHAGGRLCLALSPDTIRVTPRGCVFEAQSAARTAGAFVAPEQMSGSAPGPAADIYTFCMILGLMKSVDGSSIGAQQGALDWAVARGTNPNPAARFSSMNELIALLGSIPGVQPAQTGGSASTPKAKKKVRKGVWIGIAAALGIAALAAALLPYRRIAYAGAIKEAIAACKSTQMEADGVFAQIGDQMQKAKQHPDQPSFTIEVRIPDYASLDINAVEYEAPSINWAEPTKDAYLNSLRAAIEEGAKASGVSGNTVAASVTVTLSKQDGAWTGSVSEASLRTVEDQLDKALTQKLSELSEMPVEYELVCVADAKNSLLASLVNSPEYLAAVRVTNVSKTGAGAYSMELAYPDPDGVFTALASEYEADYSGRIFERFTPELSLAEFSGLPGTFAEKNGAVSVKSYGESYTLDAGSSFSLALEQARSAAADASAERIYAKWGVKAETKPSDCRLILGTSTGESSLEFTLGDYAQDCYILLFRVQNSVSEGGTLQFSLWVKSGYTVTADVPAGLYRVVFAYGDTWYGSDYLFGPNGRYLQLDEAVAFQQNYIKQFTVNSWTADGIDWHEVEYDVDLSV